LESVITVDEQNNWSNQKLNKDKTDYVYYAIFELHEYKIRCYNNNDTSYGGVTDDKGRRCNQVGIKYGSPMHTNGIEMPQAMDETELE
jgi:hypothetical protein